MEHMETIHKPSHPTQISPFPPLPPTIPYTPHPYPLPPDTPQLYPYRLPPPTQSNHPTSWTNLHLHICLHFVTVTGNVQISIDYLLMCVFCQ